MMIVNPYLGFAGNCREAFEFYAKTLGGKIDAMMTHAESPMADQTPADWRGKIMHARLSLGDQVLMAGDMRPDHYEKPVGFSVSVSLDTAKEAERVFAAFSQGGTVGMPLQETFFAERFGIVTDRFGTPWMVNCLKPHQ
jgi:PhnB protein